MSEILVNSLKTAAGVNTLSFDSTGDVLLASGKIGRVAGNTIQIDSDGVLVAPSVSVSSAITLPAGSIDSDMIGAGAVKASKIASGAVEGAMTTQFGRRNLIINGAMQVAQRGTSNTSFTYGYTVDRMYLDQFSATGSTHTYQQLSSDPPVGFRNYLRWQRNSGETATGAMRIYYTGETGASEGIAGNKLTLSFYARAGSDYSGGSLETRIVTGEGTDQSRSGWANGLWTNQVNDSQSNTLTTSWQRFTHTLASTAGNNVSQHALRFVWSPTGTAGTNDYIEITGIQLEIGSVATPFEHHSYGEELMLCGRYYQKSGGQNQWLYAISSGNNGYRRTPVKFVPQMRATPSLTYAHSGSSNSGFGVQHNTPVGTDFYADGVADGDYIGLASWTADSEL